MPDILIKNMVCPRCIMAVEKVFKDSDIPFQKVQLGKVTTKTPVSKEQESVLEAALLPLGFELLKGKEVQTVERIKNSLHSLLEMEEIPSSLNLSDHIKEAVPEDYSRLSHLFSTLEGITIERYFISLKLEKTKELLFNRELQLSEIAWKLGYSSVQHLSNQFKKIVGMTPSAYKKMKDKPRESLDGIK